MLKGPDVHLLMDIYATHKTPGTKARPVRHPQSRRRDGADLRHVDEAFAGHAEFGQLGSVPTSIDQICTLSRTLRVALLPVDITVRIDGFGRPCMQIAEILAEGRKSGILVDPYICAILAQ